MAGILRVGIGGWVFPPWRDSFYPPKLSQKQELAYASRQVTSIEINGSFYRTPSRDSFIAWRDATPEGFVFALKGSRFITNRRVLAEAGPSIERFFASGVLELGAKLGPINWQFMPTKRFDPVDFAAFLALLPHSVEGCAIRHAVELRHPSFEAPEAIALCRAHGVAIVRSDGVYPHIDAPAERFTYLRLLCATEENAFGYPEAALDALATSLPALYGEREVFVYFINGFKPFAPRAAMKLIEKSQ